ncbi:hypothetical protein BKA93DRAFT_31273 [Sparassis latifolia]
MSDENERDNSQVSSRLNQSSCADFRSGPCSIGPRCAIFRALLRGVNFGNRATVNISEVGLTVSVEDARTLLGLHIYSVMFSTIIRTTQKPSLRRRTHHQKEDEDEEQRNTAFEIPLNTFH